jgi:hypothetical protein
MTPIDQILSRNANEHLGIQSLKPRMTDALDLHDVAVWQVRAALKAAFDAGSRPASVNAQRRDTPPDEPVAGAWASPMVISRGTPLLPGKMYLRLYHGRTDPAQEMDDWGFVGPTFGPLSCYVQTYCCNFRIHGDDDSSEVWLEKHDDVIRWDGCFYGDMELFIAGTNDKA